MSTENFNQAIDRWIDDIEQRTFVQVSAKPSPTSWSLGQVGMHLIEGTHHYLKEVKICLSTHDHFKEEMAANAKKMFRDNEFPDELIEGPSENAETSQPKSKEELVNGLKALKEEINAVAILISVSQSEGKTKHPGLNYFNAREWFQFAEMHFRHHLRQKKRIEEFLENRARHARLKKNN